MNVVVNYSPAEIKQQKRLYGLDFVELSEQQFYLYRVGLRLIETLVSGTPNAIPEVQDLLIYNVAHIIAETTMITRSELDAYIQYPVFQGLLDKTDLNDDYISNILNYKKRVIAFVETHMMSYSLIRVEE